MYDFSQIRYKYFLYVVQIRIVSIAVLTDLLNSSLRFLYSFESVH